MNPTVDNSVRKTVNVKARIELAFEVFTAGIDSWWPRTHHIGKAPMKRAVIEGRAGGRCYSEQTDGTECDWGTVLVWEPPSRLVIAWQITHIWGYEPDLSKSSEVEVRFTPLPDSATQVDLVHRYFERHGEGGDAMRGAVDAANGWIGILRLFADQVAQVSSGGDK